MTTSTVPDDPDILSTQPISESQIGITRKTDSKSTQGFKEKYSGRYPRLQYRSPPLGVVPAYDMALELIEADKKATIAKISQSKAKIVRLEAKPNQIESETTTGLRKPDPASVIADLRTYIDQLEILKDINDPEIRWRAERDDVDLSVPIFRYLANRKWQEVPLHLTMQRITQMHITPDVIPLISPSHDVRLFFPLRSRTHLGGKARKDDFEVGEFLNSRESAKAPSIEIQSFKPGPGKYSIAIIDPDVPDEKNDAFTTYLHYLQEDVELDESKHLVTFENGKVSMPYVPPHPHKGTPYHRYTVVVWKQPESPPDIGRPQVKREGFVAMDFATQRGLRAVGISFWRQVWDENVGEVMKKAGVEWIDRDYRRIKA